MATDIENVDCDCDEDPEVLKQIEVARELESRCPGCTPPSTALWEAMTDYSEEGIYRLYMQATEADYAWYEQWVAWAKEYASTGQTPDCVDDVYEILFGVRHDYPDYDHEEEVWEACCAEVKEPKAIQYGGYCQAETKNLLLARYRLLMDGGFLVRWNYDGGDQRAITDDPGIYHVFSVRLYCDDPHDAAESMGWDREFTNSLAPYWDATFIPPTREKRIHKQQVEAMRQWFDDTPLPADIYTKLQQSVADIHRRYVSGPVYVMVRSGKKYEVKEIDYAALGKKQKRKSWRWMIANKKGRTFGDLICREIAKATAAYRRWAVAELGPDYATEAFDNLLSGCVAHKTRDLFDLVISPYPKNKDDQGVAHCKDNAELPTVWAQALSVRAPQG